MESDRPPGARIGYARVSTDEQNLRMQVDALQVAGCDRIFTDQGISGADFCRPGLDAALEQLRPGDALVVWRLDRLGRSLTRLVDLINFLARREVDFICVMESINTQSPGGVLVFHMMAALAEFERSVISERTRAGLAAARAQGAQLGRKRALSPAQLKQALQLARTLPLTEVARRFNVHPRTVKRMLTAHATLANSGAAVPHIKDASLCPNVKAKKE
ncbi:recombinase family protein [Paraburkholderia humisilvae]|uniref:recombinase family protein n=1 Tax=Paraburkholderia humisilvae TaxID=627669 RepID=UPI0024846502|nr:recombinase family protein [Paraburkholderia humisilvae]